MHYLCQNTHLYINFSVHQCTHFSTNPKASHEQVFMWIVRYFLHTKTKGINFTPTKEYGLNCYVDSDFAGLFRSENLSKRASALSYTGFAIKYSAVPILWVSKLQTEIAMSMTEAKYIALSNAMRELITAQALLKELSALVFLPLQQKILWSTVFEDNTGAME